MKRTVNRLRQDCIEVYSFEVKDHKTPQGEKFEAVIEIKVKRGQHNERLLDYMDELDDVTITCIE